MTRIDEKKEFGGPNMILGLFRLFYPKPAEREAERCSSEQ